MSYPLQVFKPIRSKRTFEEISGRIKELIFEGVLKPGDRLPSEIELAKMLGVGRQSVREALRLLELSGFLSVQRGVKGGPVVEDTIFNKMGSLFLSAFKFKKISIEDLTKARIEIEKSVLLYAIENADAEDLKRLRGNLRKAKNTLRRGRPAFEENIEFHRLLAKSSKNHVFILVMESILAVLSDFRSRVNEVGLDRSRAVTLCHEKILKALQDKRKEEALQILDNHLKEVQQILIQE
jgi:GntR family transcriptional repressor for pyruvate dehydrogenase complex